MMEAQHGSSGHGHPKLIFIAQLLLGQLHCGVANPISGGHAQYVSIISIRHNCRCYSDVRWQQIEFLLLVSVVIAVTFYGRSTE